MANDLAVPPSQLNITLRIGDSTRQLLQQILTAVQGGTNQKLDVILHAIQTTGDSIMTQLSDLQTKVDAAFAAAGQAFTDVSAKLDALAQQIADLKAQVAAGGVVTQADLDAFATNLGAAADATTAGAAALEAKITPAP